MRGVPGGGGGGVHVDRPGKDPVFSRTCVTLEEQRERAGDLFDRTVVVKVLQGGNPSCGMILRSRCPS